MSCLERVSIECQKVIPGLAFTTIDDWLKNLAPLLQIIQSASSQEYNQNQLWRVR